MEMGHIELIGLIDWDSVSTILVVYSVCVCVFFQFYMALGYIYNFFFLPYNALSSNLFPQVKVLVLL
jgi:hypothetical protein